MGGTWVEHGWERAQRARLPQFFLVLLAFAVPLAFYPGIRSGALAPRWGLMAAALPLLAAFLPNLRLGWGHLAGAALYAYALLTLPHNADGLQALIFLSIVACGVLCGEFLTEKALVAFSWGLALSVPFLWFQWMGLSPFEEAAGPAGLFTNKNVWAEAAACGLIIALYTHRWVLLAALGGGFWLSNSRGALLGLMAAFIVWLWHRSRFWAVICALGAVPTAAALATYIRLSASAERFAIWQDTALGLTLWGHGLGSFFQLYPVVQQYTDALAGRADHAHNDYLEAAFELGLPGAVALVACVLWALWGRHELERLIVAAVAAAALVGFPLHMPTTAFIFALCAGRLWASRPLLCLDLAVRRKAYAQRRFGWQ